MAAEDKQKKWGTIFMGDREASVEQLNAMQEPLRREKLRQEYAEDYMERVRARAADRAREILGAAYAEKQKVLEEAKKEILAQKREAAEECSKMRSEGEITRKLAHAELEKARAEREEAEKIRAAAHEEGFQAGMEKADVELHEFRAAQGQALASVLHALEREKKNIISFWREDLALLTQCAAQAGTGLVLEKEHQAVLRSLVFKALDMLETQGTVTVRVNPADETTVGEMFQVARERFPDLKQWIVIGDAHIEPGGLVAESGSGSVDLKRQNFRDMVDNVLCHLALPEQEGLDPYDIRDIVEREVAHIASLTPEMEPQLPPESEPEPDLEPDVTVESEEKAALTARIEYPEEDGQRIPEEEESAIAETQADAAYEEPAEDEAEELESEEISLDIEDASIPEDEHGSAHEQTLEELEDELFPLEQESATTSAVKAPEPEKEVPKPDPRTLAEGGFL